MGLGEASRCILLVFFWGWVRLQLSKVPRSIPLWFLFQLGLSCRGLLLVFPLVVFCSVGVLISRGDQRERDMSYHGLSKLPKRKLDTNF